MGNRHAPRRQVVTHCVTGLPPAADRRARDPRGKAPEQMGTGIATIVQPAATLPITGVDQAGSGDATKRDGPESCHFAAA